MEKQKCCPICGKFRGDWQEYYCMSCAIKIGEKFAALRERFGNDGAYIRQEQYGCWVLCWTYSDYEVFYQIDYDIVSLAQDFGFTGPFGAAVEYLEWIEGEINPMISLSDYITDWEG